EHLIARLPVLDGISDRRDDPGGLDAQGHRRGAADVPVACPDELLPVADARGPDFDQDLVVREGARIWEIDPPDSTAELADTGGPHQRGAVSAGPGSAMKVRIRSATASAKKVNTLWVYPGCRVATQRCLAEARVCSLAQCRRPGVGQFVPLPHYLDVLLRQRARSISRRQSGSSGRGFLTRCRIGVG